MKSNNLDRYVLNPVNRFVTYSDDPKHPLWTILVKFFQGPPMKELIKAPSKSAARLYAKAKYPEAEIIFLEDKPVRLKRKGRTRSKAS